MGRKGEGKKEREREEGERGGVVEVGTLCMKRTKPREGGGGEKDGWTGVGREGEEREGRKGEESGGGE